MNIDYAYLIFGYFFAEQFGDCAIMNTGQLILAPSRPHTCQPPSKKRKDYASKNSGFYVKSRDTQIVLVTEE